MGNEVSRPNNVSPADSRIGPSCSPCTPKDDAYHQAQRGGRTSSLPLQTAENMPSQRRTNRNLNLVSSPDVTAKSHLNGTTSLDRKKERMIQHMDKAIRRRVRGGVTYNMKLLIRGAKGTGKTSLFERLQGNPIPETHFSTPQLQSATIKWDFCQNMEENIKCEVWDVVDHGFVSVKAANGDEKNTRRRETASAVEKEGVVDEVMLSAADAAATMPNSSHSVAVADTSTVSVYHEAHGVIFLLDITKRDTLEYVRQQLDNVPVNIPTLVLGNFRDQGAQRKVFKEDIQEMLYGLSDRLQSQQRRRPTELLYFECSLLNCYGLKSLHQYFGIPFLQLKLATIRQQLRIIEADYTRVKLDVQATIGKQRYAEYVEHIKTTGSDIRTGRRTSGMGSTPAVLSCDNSAILVSDGVKEKLATHEDGMDNECKENIDENTSLAMTCENSHHEVAEHEDVEDLPVQNDSIVMQTSTPSSIQTKQDAVSLSDDVVDVHVVKSGDKHALPTEKSSEALLLSNGSPNRFRSALNEEVIRLEDFQVPKTQNGDLDHFYSENDSGEDIGDNDEDVVVAPADGKIRANFCNTYHKQHFLDSDSSDLAEELTDIRRRRKVKASQKCSFPHRRATRLSKSVVSISTRSHESARPPPSPSAASPRSQQRTPFSTRSQLSRPIQNSEGMLHGTSLQQQLSSGPTSAAALTSTHIAAQPTFASPVLSRQLSTRRKNKASFAAPNSGTLVLELQGESGLKNATIVSEESELSRTNNNALHSSGHQQSFTEEESTKRSRDAACFNDIGANDNENYSSAATLRASVAVMPDDALDIGINSKANTNLVVSSPNQNSDYVERESIEGLTDAGHIGSSTHELTAIPAHDQKEEYNDNAAAISQANEDMPRDSVALTSLEYGLQKRMCDDESYCDASDSSGSTELPVPLLTESLPDLFVSSALPVSSKTDGVESKTSQDLKDFTGHSSSLSALQSSLALPIETPSSAEALLPVEALSPHSSNSKTTKGPMDMSNGSSAFTKEAALRSLNLQIIPPVALPSEPVMLDAMTVNASDDLEAFLNESDSDLENALPPSSCSGLADGNNQQTKERQINEVDVLKPAERYGVDDQDRFARYSISKKDRIDLKRQQREDLRELNAALNIISDPFISSPNAVVATTLPLGTSSVMEAIRKAKETAMCMLPIDPAPTVVRETSVCSNGTRISARST